MMLQGSKQLVGRTEVAIGQDENDCFAGRKWLFCRMKVPFQECESGTLGR